MHRLFANRLGFATGVVVIAMAISFRSISRAYYARLFWVSAPA
jgi:hypothetical protein